MRTFLGEIPSGERERKHHVLKAHKGILRRSKVSSVLDAGSGDGVYSFWFAKKLPDAHVCGIDIDAERIEGCQFIAEKFNIGNVEFRTGDLSNLDAEDEFDVITCTDVLEHLEDDTGQIQRFFRALTSGGHLVIHVPTGAGPHPLTKNAPPIPNHVRDGYAPDALNALLSSAGFEIEQTKVTFGYFGALAAELYELTQRPLWLRLIVFPLNALLVAIDVRGTHIDGQGVMVVTVKPGGAV